MIPKCPICRSALAQSSAPAPWRPFCSERCKLVDLSKWLGGDYILAQPSDKAHGGDLPSPN